MYNDRNIMQNYANFPSVSNKHLQFSAMVDIIFDYTSQDTFLLFIHGKL